MPEAWSLRFRNYRYVAASQFGARGKANAGEVAQTTVAGQMNPSGFDYLMVRVPVGELSSVPHPAWHVRRD